VEEEEETDETLGMIWTPELGIKGFSPLSHPPQAPIPCQQESLDAS
jgi:hypothetical protein